MSDPSRPKKPLGRGRGLPVKGEGPWARSKKLDDLTQDVRPPKKQGDSSFELSPSSFPPLPGAATLSEQPDNVEATAGSSSNLNGRDFLGGQTNKTLTEKESMKTPLPSAQKDDSIDSQTVPRENHKDLQTSLQTMDSSIEIAQETKETTVGKAEDNTKVKVTNKLTTVRHPHEDDLKRSDKAAKRPATIAVYNNEKVLVKQSGRKFKIKSDGTLGEELLMLDDLRRAFIFTQEHLAKKKDEDKKINEILKKRTSEDSLSVDITNSNLSPYAVEFIPKAANMNPEARDFIPTSFDVRNNNSSTMTSNYNVNDTAAILADLEETVGFCYSKLMESPGSYDELMGVVTPHFVKYMGNPDMPHEIVRTLLGYAITDTKFSYFAVKILIHLAQVTSTEEEHVLRDSLLRHAQEEVQIIQTVRLPNPEVSCVNDIQPFLMFLSELYIQLEVGGSRLVLVGGAIVDILNKLLIASHIQLQERLRLIINILKLTGLSLDQDNPSLLDGLFTEISVIMDREGSCLDGPTTQVVNDIILLRNLRWGLVEPEDYLQSDNIPVSPNGNQVYEFEQGFDSSLPYATGVFYGPDGLPIDYEQQMFLEVETNNLNQLQLEQSEHSPTSDGYDEAYQEFLNTIPSNKGNSKKN